MEVIRFVRQLCEIDRDTMGEPWTAYHWLHDLPGKWELSRVALLDDTVRGVAVVSRKPEAAHIHRLAVDAPLRGRGLGAILVGAVAAAADAAGDRLLSLKVEARNHRAIAFYEALRFATIESTERQLVMHATPHDVVVAAASRAAAHPR